MAAGGQPAQQVAQAIDIGGAVAGFVMVGRGGGIDHLIQGLAGPVRGWLDLGQVARHGQQGGGQGGDIAPEAEDAVTLGHQLQAKAAADIATTGDQDGAHRCFLLQRPGQTARVA